MIAAPSLATFMAASTDAALQAREQAEIKKYADFDCTPPWQRSKTGDNRDWSDRSSSSQGDISNRDCPDRFHTSPVTASNLLGVSTEMPSQLRRDCSAAQMSTTNRFALLEVDGDDDDDEQGEHEHDEQNQHDPDQYDSGEETARRILQQPGGDTNITGCNRPSHHRPNSDPRP